MTKTDIDSVLVEAIGRHACPIGGAMFDYDPIVSAAQNCRHVLIGEASHGTREFYRARAEITERLIDELGFDAVAVEADWPDAYTVNRHVCSAGSNVSPEAALADFERFPTWMWRNVEILHFVNWLRAFNIQNANSGEGRRPVGFYGLDLYSMSTSAHAVIDYLDKTDPEAAMRARIRYSCLDHFAENPQSYGRAIEFGITEDCEDEIVAQLVELRKKAREYMEADGLVAEDEFFCAEQNAKLVRNAEKYYRAMFRGRPNSWNLRDQHMFETLQDLDRHLSDQLGREARIVVWAHNSHVGNAGATDMSRRGEFNIGQLVQHEMGEEALLIGFTTCRGTVTAASGWDAPVERKTVRDPMPDSYEEVFHHVNHKQFLIDLREDNEAVDMLMVPRLERAIGVIYRPETERSSHYFRCCLPEQFDFLLHFDVTEAVEPLDTTPHWRQGELDETYPSGL